MKRKEISGALAMALTGLVIGALLTLLFKGQIDWFFSFVIAINYLVISLLYWRWKRR